MSVEEFQSSEKTRDLGELMGLGPMPSKTEAANDMDRTLQSPVPFDLGMLMGLGAPEPLDVDGVSLPPKGQHNGHICATSGTLEENALPPQNRQQPFHRVGDPPLWTFEKDRSGKTFEKYRILKNQIAGLNSNRGFKIFLITSTEKNERIPIVALNLALFLGWDLPNLRILMIEALSADATVYNERGGLKGSAGSKLRKNFIRESCLPNLDLLPMETDSSRKAKPVDYLILPNAIRPISQPYDLVFLSAEMPYPSSATRLLSQKADGAVFVTRSKGIRWMALNDLIYRLQDDGTHFVGSFSDIKRFSFSDTKHVRKIF